MKKVKQLLCLLLAMVMVITAVPNMQAYAKDKVTPNASDKKGNMGNLTTCHGGASVRKQGYRLYIVDQNGDVVSVFKTHNKKGEEVEAQVRDLYVDANEGTTTVGDDLRVGDGDLARARMKVPAGMPAAFVGEDWKTNGEKVAKWMNTKVRKPIDYTDKNGKKHHEVRWMKNCQWLCYYAMGIRAFKMAMDYESKYTIVLEPTVFHVVWKSTSKNSSTGTSFYGTAYEWLQKYNKMGVAKTWTSSCESYVLQCALTLQRKEHDLTKPTSEVTKSKQLTLKRVGNQGFGIHFYTLNTNPPTSNKTHTFDYQYNNSKFRPEKAPKEKKSEGITIVKTYRVKKINKDGDVKYIDKGTYVRKETLKEIDIENEPTSNVQYHVIGYQTTDKVKKDIDALKWKSIMDDKEQVGNATKSATVKPNNDAVVTTVTLHKKVEKQKNKKTGKTETVKQKHDETVLYVLLQKEEKEKPISGDYTLKQSQISKRVDLYKTEKDKNILKGHSFVWDSSALNDACGGHTYYCSSENCSGHGPYYCSWSLDDTSLSLAIMNARYRADEYKYNIAYKAWNDEWEDTEVSGNRKTLSSYSFNSQDLSNIGGGTHRFEHYYLVFHRGKDALCLAKWKNEADGINTASLEKLDSFYSANESRGLRRKTDFLGKISTKFIDNSDDIYTSSYGSRGCSDSDVADSPIPFIANIEIAYLTFSGSKSGGSSNNDIEDETMTNPGVHSGTHDGITYSSNTVSTATMAKSGLKFSFFPYIRMRYDSMSDSDKEVYVLGEYARSLNFNSACQVIWDKTSKPNMTIESLQWSTHSQALKNHEVNSVLPGGATFTLRILSSSKKAKNNRQTITVKTYQPVLEGDGLTQVKNTTLTNGLNYSKFTRTAAEKNDEKTTKNIVEALNQLKVAQWQNKKDNSDPFKGILVDSGTDISSLSTGSSQASTAKKYYFKAAKGKGFINAHVASTSKQFYTFTADYKGNIKMNGTTILTKGQGKSYIKKLKDEPNDSPKKIAWDINEKTLVLEKLCDALERNRGYDDDAGWAGSDGKWYNEAFDGITYEEITTKIETGMIKPTERSSVLDPKLCPINQGKSDFFSHFQTAGIKMNSYSNMYYNMDNLLGYFNGKEIYTEDLDKLYYTKPFYVPNVNVQDLH